MKYTIRKASENDKNSVLQLYREAIGTKGCVWDETYPSEKEINNDISQGTLYVYSDGEKIAGAVSVVPENELDELPEWSICDGSHCEIARVVISKSYRGMGLSPSMLTELFDILRSKGIKSIHMLVEKNNLPALSLYKKLGFNLLGEHFMYGHDYFSGELLI